MQLLGLHRDVGGLLDQGVDIDFVLVLGPYILTVKYYNTGLKVSDIRSTGS